MGVVCNGLYRIDSISFAIPDTHQIRYQAKMLLSCYEIRLSCKIHTFIFNSAFL